jgi:ATP-dependent Clp protease ATP-binding subunit ClpX
MSQEIKCSLCQKFKHENPLLDFFTPEEHPNYICSECIDTFSIAKTKVLELRNSDEDKTEKSIESYKEFSLENMPDPSDVFSMLNDHIIGQIEAKESISIAVAHHYRRMLDPSIGKSNILLIGPTGTGKTEIARTIANYLKVPFTTADATTFTSKGYVGEDIDAIIGRLLVNAKWDVQKAEKGIVFIDEIDKIVKRGNSNDSGVNTVSVQQELLRLLEGDKIKINKNSPTSPSGIETVYINTKDILFICAGAFIGLQESVIQSLKSSKIGLNTTETITNKDSVFWGDSLESKHLINHGMIPELLGRLPVIAITTHLTQDDLVKIITEPKNSISNQYKSLFKMDNIKLEFSKDFCLSVADEAINKNLGARGLRQIIEKRMKKTFFKVNDFKNKTIIMNKTGEDIF